MELYKYVDDSGQFDYEKYRQVQIAGNKRKIENQWAQEPVIAYLCDYVKLMLGEVAFGLCHGTRRGGEQEWFSRHLGCPVIGTEISETARDFPNTVQWDFHEMNEEWRDKADFIYSNSWDHVYDPEKAFTTWMACLRPGGICFLEHSASHVRASELGPFGATVEELVLLLVKLGRGQFYVRDVVSGSPVLMVNGRLPAKVQHVILMRL